MTDIVSPPCDADQTPLPAVGDRGRRYGEVHGVDPAHGTVLVLRDGAYFSEVYPAADWEVVP